MELKLVHCTLHDAEFSKLSNKILEMSNILENNFILCTHSTYRDKMYVERTTGGDEGGGREEKGLSEKRAEAERREERGREEGGGNREEEGGGRREEGGGGEGGKRKERREEGGGRTDAPQGEPTGSDQGEDDEGPLASAFD
jgi:hypothetical protein